MPLLGMEKYLRQFDEAGIQNQMADYVTTKELEFTASASHGGFDNDANTLNYMLMLFLGRDPASKHTFGGDSFMGY